jgi:hypothetical protein
MEYRLAASHAHLLFLSEVPHSLLVAGCPPLRTPLFGPWALGLGPAGCGCGLRRAAAAAAGCGAGAETAAAQHPLLGLACGAKGRKQSKRIGG